MNQEGNLELFEIELTKTQLMALSSVLPKGFSLELVHAQSGSTGSHPSKKVFTNDKKPVAKKPAKSSTYKAHTDNNNLSIKPVPKNTHKRKCATIPVSYTYPDLDIDTPAKSLPSNNEPVRKCLNILQRLKKHQAAGPFLYPVDVKGLGLYDYYSVIKEPMDISTAEQKLKKGYYATPSQFATDVRKIWSNAITYNMEGSSIYLMTLEMRAYFEKLYREIDDAPANDAVRDLEKQVEMLTRQIHDLHSSGGLMTAPVATNVTNVTSLKANNKTHQSNKAKSNKNSKVMEKPLSVEERSMLAQNIKKLSAEHLRGVWDLVTQRLDPEGLNGDELEFDVDYLPVSVARELEKYVKSKLALVNRRKKRAQAKEAKKMGQVKPYSQQEEVVSKEDDITTQHHSVVGSDGGNDGRDVNMSKDDDLLSNSSGSSFISDSESEGEDNDEGLNYNEGKGRQMTVSGNFMLNSFIEN